MMANSVDEPARDDPVDVPLEEIPSTTEQLDEDELGADVVEDGMDPPDHWAGAVRYAQSPFELRQGPRLQQRLAEEEPDTRP